MQRLLGLPPGKGPNPSGSRRRVAGALAGGAIHRREHRGQPRPWGGRPGGPRGGGPPPPAPAWAPPPGRGRAEGAGAPIAGERRVILIEGVDRASEQTQNALLKALEEPTSRHMFVLVADEPTRLLPTIRSRSQALRVGSVPRAELVAWLVDRERLPVDQADALSRIAGGMAGTAIGYARSPHLVDWRRRTQRELLGLLGRGRADRFSSVRDLLDDAARLGVEQPGREEVPDGGEGVRPASGAPREAALLVVEAWLGLARDLAVSAAGRPHIAAAAALDPELPALAEQIGQPAIRDFIALLERIRDGLRQNAAPRLALEVAMLAWPTRVAR